MKTYIQDNCLSSDICALQAVDWSVINSWIHFNHSQNSELESLTCMRHYIQSSICWIASWYVFYRKTQLYIQSMDVGSALYNRSLYTWASPRGAARAARPIFEESFPPACLLVKIFVQWSLSGNPYPLKENANLAWRIRTFTLAQRLFQGWHGERTYFGPNDFYWAASPPRLGSDFRSWYSPHFFVSWDASLIIFPIEFSVSSSFQVPTWTILSSSGVSWYTHGSSCTASI